MSIQSISEAIEKLPSDNQGGSLAFFGSWFGKIPDNLHTLISINIEKNTLILGFNMGETLEISDPSNMEIMDDALIILSASSVDWYWNSYDEKPSPENRNYYKFKRVGSDIHTNTNTNRRHPMIPKKDEPAFEMAWYMRGDMSHQPYHRQLGKVRKP